MRIVFRTDASHDIGTGHVMRCLTLARGLRERGADCSFVCRALDGNQLGRIRDSGFSATELSRSRNRHVAEACDAPVLSHADWLEAGWQADAQQTIEALKDGAVDWLVVDHYALDRRWEERLRLHVKKIMVIDDLADRAHDCDLLLDQNLVLDSGHRYHALLPPGCACLLGPHYALLQPEYAELLAGAARRSGPVRRILVFFGGSDQENLTGLAISAFLALKRDSIALDVVIHSQSPHAAGIQEQARRYSNITIHSSLPSLAPLMLKADLAIGAGGVTSWERCCLGLPSLVVATGENQLRPCEALASAGLIDYLGSKNDLTVERLYFSMQASLDCASQRQRVSESGPKLVDGRGADRVAEMLLTGNSGGVSFCHQGGA